MPENEQWYCRGCGSGEDGRACSDECRCDCHGPKTVAGPLVAHYDMGRKGDLSSLTIAMPHLNFDDQLAVCRTILDRLPVVEFRIDTTGVGAALADELTDSHGPDRIMEVRA